MRAELHPDARVNRTGGVAELIEAEQLRPDALLLRWAEAGDAGSGAGSAAAGQTVIEWTVADFAAAARACAAELRRRGVTRGDRVAIMSGNSARRLAWQFGAWWIGAVEVSLNSELRGEMLTHCIEDSDPALILLEAEFEGFLDGIAPGVPRASAETPPPAVSSVEAAELDAAYGLVPASELCTILYTSGTTGPSKGVMLPQGYFANMGAVFGAVLGMRSDDVGYFTLPFFHVDFHLVFCAAIETGAAIAFNRRFSVSRFWEEARLFDASWVFVIGALLSALETREAPRTGHRVERFIGAPIPQSSREFFGAAGIRIQAFYGQTECDGPTFETPERHRDGSMGWACAGIDLEIHDPSGNPLGAGEIGELVLRPQHPNMIALGYWRRPEATLATRTDLWHHTGDLCRFDADGFFWFVGRTTDSLRRRGENISAYELEAVLLKAPGMRECAAVAVFDELGGEDEIKVVALVQDGFDMRGFFEYCRAQLPRFAVPRYVELVPEGTFVRSVGTGVIQKHRLSTDTEGDSIYDRAHVLGETR